MKPHPLLLAAVVAAGLVAGRTAPVAAVVNPGQAAPAFTKSVLDSLPWPTASLADFAGRVLVLHILGYD